MHSKVVEICTPISSYDNSGLLRTVGTSWWFQSLCDFNLANLPYSWDWTLFMCSFEFSLLWGVCPNVLHIFFFIVLSVEFLLIFRSPLSILSINPLSDLHVAKPFSHSLMSFFFLNVCDDYFKAGDFCYLCCCCCCFL